MAGKFKVKLKKTRSKPKKHQTSLAFIKILADIREEDRVAVRNKFEVLREAEKVDQQKVKSKEAVSETVEEQISRVKRKTKQRWRTEDIFDFMKKKKVAYKIEKLSIKQSEKSVMKPKRSGSMTSTETSNRTAEVPSRQCTKTLKKSLERKPANPSNDLNHKTMTSFLKKKS